MLPPMFSYSIRDIAPRTRLLLAACAAWLCLPGTVSAQPAPPPEAFDACAGQAEGAACGFNAPHGRVNGACYVMGADLLCVPSFMPPPPRQGFGRQRPPGPPQAFDRRRQGGGQNFGRQRPPRPQGFGQGRPRPPDMMAGQGGFRSGQGRMGRQRGPGLRGYAKARPFPDAVLLDNRIPETGQVVSG